MQLIVIQLAAIALSLLPSVASYVIAIPERK